MKMTLDPPPMLKVKSLEPRLTSLYDAVQRARGAWNMTDLKDAMNSVHFFAEIISQEIDK